MYDKHNNILEFKRKKEETVEHILQCGGNDGELLDLCKGEDVPLHFSFSGCGYAGQRVQVTKLE